MDRVSDDIETLVWIDGKGRPRITQTIKSEKTVEFEIMDRINEKRLEWLLGGLDLDVWKMPEHIRNNFTSALTELRERREAEKADATKHDQECPYCGEYHDTRVACNSYEMRREREKAPCPEHEKMVAEWDTYEMGRDDSSAAPFWCQLYKDGILKGQGIGMTMEDAIRQAAGNRD